MQAHMPEKSFPTTISFIGCTGVGKSSLANAFLLGKTIKG